MILEWIMEREGHAPANVDLQGLIDFTLAWGYVESKVMPNVTGYRSLGADVFSSVIEIDAPFEVNQWILAAYDEYRGRYHIQRGGRSRLAGLFLSRQLQREVASTFRNRAPLPQFKARTVGFIVSRLRNNLFHGTKDFHAIINQQGLLTASAKGLWGLLVGLEPRLNPAAG